MSLFTALIQCALLFAYCNACTDFYMNFSTPDIKLSVRTLDLGLETTNWTLTGWPRESRIDFSTAPPMSLKSQLSGGFVSKYEMIGITANWLGDEHWGFPSFFADSMNEMGLSCSLLTLIHSKYEERSSTKVNVFAGSFCKWASGQFASVADVKAALPDIAIWGPDELDQHFILRDRSGASLVVEMLKGKKQVYDDPNNGKDGFGITTNEPTFDWHLENIKHYEWKRTLARQSIAVPGSWYPDERFLRVHMVKTGMSSLEKSATNFATAFALCAQVLNTISVPQGDQYGTDSGESSGEGSNDHTVFGVIRDHANPALYWRDNGNPTFRKVSLADLRLAESSQLIKSLKLESGPAFVDLTSDFQ